ncbi:MAG: DUF1810 domain-containing protein [Pseudonocardia sp.]
MPEGDGADLFRLGRFVDAQDRRDVYAYALAELQRGQKVGHWMWFVFPQIRGLGRSAMAQEFAISSLKEARAYLAHPVLGPRLRECSAVLTLLRELSAVQIFGSTDAMKLRSSMTLFHRAAPDEVVFRNVLDRYFDGRTDDATDRLL